MRVPKYELGGLSVLEDKRVDPTGATDSTAGILNIISIAEAEGLTVVYPPGDYMTTATIVHLQEVNADSNATLIVNHGGIGLQYSNDAARTYHVKSRLPSVVKANPVWSAGNIGGDVGISLDGVRANYVEVPYVSQFSEGVRMTGGPNSYNTIWIGALENNGINLRMSPAPGGWVNQNTIIGGRFQHYSSVGVNAPGTRHISMDMGLNGNTGTSYPNGNTFLGCSIESPTVAEVLVYCEGSWNMWLNNRYEYTGGGAVMQFSGNFARHNEVIGGIQNDILDIQQINGARSNIQRGQHDIHDNSSNVGLLRMRNGGSSAFPQIRGYPSGVDPHEEATEATDWTYEITAFEYHGKRQGDTVNRIELDHVNGRVTLADSSLTQHVLSVDTSGRLLIDGVVVGTQT